MDHLAKGHDAEVFAQTPIASGLLFEDEWARTLRATVASAYLDRGRRR